MTYTKAAALTPSPTQSIDRHGVRRGHDGRPYIWVPKLGKEIRYSRVTTFIDCMEDKHNLEQWAKRILLIGLQRDEDLRIKLALADPDDRDELNAIVARAHELGDGFVAANKGTDLHSLTEVVDEHGLRAEDATSWGPGDFRDMSAYHNTMMTRLGLRVVERERFVVVDQLQIAGTFDKMVDRYVDTTGREHRNVIADLKTGSVDFGPGKFAMQGAAYSRGMYYDPITRKRKRTGASRDIGLVIHLPQGQARCDVYEMDLNRGWRDVLLAKRIRQSRRDGKDTLTLRRPA